MKTAEDIVDTLFTNYSVTDQSGKDHLIHGANYLMEEDWTPKEVYSLLRWHESIQPDLGEEYALRKMQEVYNLRLIGE